MKNKIQGYLSLILVVAVMFVVVFGVTGIEKEKNKAESAPKETETTTQTSKEATSADITVSDSASSDALAEETSVSEPIVSENTSTSDGEIPTAEPVDPSEVTGPYKVMGGVYEGEAKGNGGTITAKVTIEDGYITTVKVTGEHESQGIGSVAVESIPGKVVEAQSLEVDTVSGATVSSKGVLAAIANALVNAGVDASELSGFAE